jgi:hypothetical protein
MVQVVRKEEQMRKQVASLVAIAVISACTVLAAQTPQSGPETYEWSGQLVSLDENTRTVTIKARLVDQEGVADLKQFKAGQRVTLWWSGSDKYADGIRRVMPSPGSLKEAERFHLPVELVSTEAPNQYVTFRLRIPTATITTLKTVKSGEWVTVNASHRPAGEADAVVSIRPYVMTSAATSDQTRRQTMWLE